jgi:hypothetical protein
VERQIITLDEAQVAAEAFLEDRLKGLKKLAIGKIKLASIEGIVVYEVEGVAILGELFFRTTEHPFKVQVAALDRSIVGYEL